MDKTWQTKSAVRVTLIGVVLALAAGCAQLDDWLNDRRSSRVDEPIILGAPAAETYLKDLYDLTLADAPAQAETFADAQSAATLTPTPNTRLRFALILATPGHSGSDAEKAQRLLREILAHAELLTPAEVSLATIHLNDVERFIVANEEAARLRAYSSQIARSEEQAISQRLSTVEAENRRLRAELEVAEEKLEAITSIERSIREQE